MIRIPARCLPLLREQRTQYNDLPTEYGQELAHTFETFRDYLPVAANKILDIGSGMAGIDVFLGHHYPNATIHLLDKNGVSEEINAGFNERVEDFAHYNDFSAALALLHSNDVRNPVVCHDINNEPFPEQIFDVVISLLSWGFHYPIDTYAPKCSGVMIVDVRRDTGGEAALAKYGDIHIVHEGEKHRRVVVQC